VARNAAAIGVRVDLLAMIGTDEADAALTRLLKRDGVRTQLTRDGNVNTTVKLRVIGRQQQLLRIDFENPPTPEALQAKRAEFDARVSAANVVIFSDYAKGGLAHVDEMIQSARDAGKKVLVDPKGDDFERYRHASVLTPNLGEFRAVVGRWSSEAELEEKAEKLRERLALDALLITRSEEGMTLFRGGSAVHVHAVAKEVYDVSGAGDTVIAVLGAMLAAGCDIEEAVRWANKAAGIVVGKLGTAVVNPDELFA
jgi:rfaE bifunctional protein kinase chain/domain